MMPSAAVLFRSVHALAERECSIVKDIDGIGFVYFDERDVVRHKLVQAIVKAYDSFGGSGQRNGGRGQ